MKRTEPPPDFCPLCGAATSDVQPEIATVKIAKTIGKAGDQVYRAMEESSQARVEMAAEQLGVDASELSAMKVTDLKDNTREGEMSAVTRVNPVSQFMAQTGTGGVQSAQAAQGYVNDVKQGPFAHAGNRAREQLVSQHAKTAARATAAGCVGRFA